MFKGIINWFKKGTSEFVPGAITNGQDPLGLSGETEMIARIQKLPTDKFALVTGGTVVGTYSRKRDAVRGASRRGLTVA